MKRFIAMLGCAVLVSTAPALAQTKTVRGKVTTVGANTITVNVAGKDMTFNVDVKTNVVARGGTTKSRQAQAAGKTGPGVADVLKAGDPVEVVYHEKEMHADTVRVVPSVPSGEAPPPPPPAPKAMTATGVVSAVSGNTLTIKEKTGDATFTVDTKTVVSGRGFGTAGRKLENAGGKPTLGEFVKEGDTVSVTYVEEGGTKKASNVRVTQKKM
ncbi:MAG TPA: DUF5666 domain-containing protein [Vicinamibacterales bacterium]|nr:DUF5666 domain-containing protein [Vicinamibacterales bacterium]